MPRVGSTTQEDTLCLCASYRRRHLSCTDQMRPTLACAAGVAAAAATSCSAFSLSHISSGSAAARARGDKSVTAISSPLPATHNRGAQRSSGAHWAAG
ncbi:unnamed protein product, partial [Ectocarpus sp. 12 AP-2014]